MTNLDDFMVGECMQMCSKKEMEMREKEKLLHVLEMVPGTEKSKTPKADTKRMVKCFSRSAAGKQIPQAYNLRPPDVLLKTVNYLLCEVVDANFPWHVIYDFVEDRLRAVRQDMVIQNVSLAESICLLQPIVRFYAYSTYKLCKEDLSKFDPVLNNKQLQECLKKLLSFYDEYDILLNKVHNTTNDVRCNSFLKQIRPEFEALYLIFNLGNSEALKRICTLSKIYRNSLVNLAFNISLAFCYNNFVRICRLVKKLPPLLAAVISALHMPHIRRRALEMMGIAYGSKVVLTYPLEKLKEILLYNSKEIVIAECKYYGIETGIDNIHFIKKTFPPKLMAPPQFEDFAEQKLATLSVQQLLLCTN